MISSELSASYSIGFIHMRKAGGSLIMKMFDEWLQKNKCIRPYQHLSVYGMYNGYALKVSKSGKAQHIGLKEMALPRSCPAVNIIHEEYSAIDGKQILTLPNRQQRHQWGINLTLLTSFRNPITRIVSQAFYGSNDIGYKVFNQTLYSTCGYLLKSAMMTIQRCKTDLYLNANEDNKKQCDCFWRAWNYTLNTVRTDDMIWDTWMEPRVGLGDQYVSNYYIKRLLGYTGGKAVEKGFCDVRACLSSNISLRNPQNCPLSERIILQYVMSSSNTYPYIFCLNGTLEIDRVKQLVRDHLDFVIIENVDTISSKRAIQTAFFNTYEQVTSFGHFNSGLMTSIGGINDYKDIIPHKILDRIKQENAADIELYEYAVELFKIRAKENGWDKK